MSPIHRLLCVMSLGMLLAGCTLIEGRIDIAYRVETERNSPLSMIDPLIVYVELLDQREVNDPLLIGYKKGGFGNVLASVKSKQEVSGVVRQALEAELRNNGHGIALDSAAQRNATLIVRLKQFWTEPFVKIFDVQVQASLNADIEVVDSSARRITSRTIVGTQIESWQLGIDQAYDSVLNGALRGFVRNVARDPSLLKALRQISAP